MKSATVSGPIRFLDAGAAAVLLGISSGILCNLSTRSRTRTKIVVDYIFDVKGRRYDSVRTARYRDVHSRKG